ncbi:MAG: cytochrome c biogenesis protein CcsA [Gammaproteobacteria bacterium]|nr:cytochrome c biogenesis protein CcsA [Gammaproteobacteria bacterium]MCK5091377.1 cytochrome c biogenesis protein CcsA [Gammaproteobacteria bacterium]
MSHYIINILSVSLYLVTAILLATRLAKTSKGQTQPKTSILILGLSAVILHSSLLYNQIIGPEGINLGIFNALSLISGLMALLLLVASFTKPVENLGIALLPLAAINIMLEISFPSSHIISGSWQLQAHILISIIAYSLLSIAMVQAILLAIQDQHLRNRKPGGFIQALPPLKTMESLLFQMIGIGFILLTIGLIIGTLFIEDIFAEHLAHKTILSIIAWVLFAILLWGRIKFGWRGRTAIRWTLGGFFTLMLAYFGSKFVLELILGR